MATILFEGCAFTYNIQGRGEPIVFVQGVGLHGAGWQLQTNELSSRFTCLSFDNRGMTASQPAEKQITVSQMAIDTLAIMDAANISSAHVVGHSLGGCIAQQLALTNPQRVRSLSLLCTSARGADAMRLSWRMIWLGARSRAGTRSMRRRAFVRIVFSQQYLELNDVDKTAIELEPIFGHDLADSPAVVNHQLRALQHFDASDRIRDLSAIPTLVLSASSDPIFPPRCGLALAAGIPGADFFEMPGASHGVIIEQAAAVNSVLARHIERAAEKPHLLPEHL